MSYISMPAVLEKIMQDPTYKSGKFGEVKELIMGMLETYNYELTLLETTKKILGRDLHGQYKRQKQFLTRGFKPATSKCGLCSRSTNNDPASVSVNSHPGQHEIVFFRCGHIYHQICMEGSIGFEEEPVCVLCNKSNAIRTFGYRRSNSRGAAASVNDKAHPNPRSSAPQASKPRAGKRVDIQVYLRPEQERALNNLWSDSHKSAKSALFKELVKSSPSHRERSGNIFNRTSSVSKTFDDKFALNLAPPIRMGKQ